MIDWLRVDMVCNGTALQLSREEREMAVRRLSERMLEPGEWLCTGNKINGFEVARRLNTTERTVLRIKAALPPADKDVCPVCREPMWVVDGVVEAHPDRLLTECPMSGRPVEADWEAETAATVRWLAERLRQGDVDGVWKHINDLSVSQARVLMVASLAAVPVDGPAEDLFAWIEEEAS